MLSTQRNLALEEITKSASGSSAQAENRVSDARAKRRKPKEPTAAVTPETPDTP